MSGAGRLEEVKLVEQTTLKKRIECSGVGLHTGANVRMALQPAPAGSGIVFHRCDLPGRLGTIPATIEHVSDSRLCTTLGNAAGVTVATVEHLLSALAGCGVDNVVVEVDGPEVPIMDGSAAPFVFLVECAGIVEQGVGRRAIEVTEVVVVGSRDKYASLSPAPHLRLGFEIDYPSRAIARQRRDFVFSVAAFKAEVGPARTFGFMDEIEHLRSCGLALGGSLDNAVVVSGDHVLNEGGLRYADEFVRHKILDSIGDLCLLGAPMIGRFYGCRSGHALNHELLRALRANRRAWHMVDLVEEAPYGEDRWAEPAQAYA